METKISYLMAVKVNEIEKGVYCAGAFIYRITAGAEDRTKQLIKKASLYIQTDNKANAHYVTINTLLEEIEDGSNVTIVGNEIGTNRLCLHYQTREKAEAKRLFVLYYDNYLKNDREELKALQKAAAKRKSNHIATN